MLRGIMENSASWDSMPEPQKAVFISYASEDAEAAARVANALKSAGLEVWFEKSELRGGYRDRRLTCPPELAPSGRGIAINQLRSRCNCWRAISARAAPARWRLAGDQRQVP
jgi:hypothetical protein